MSLRAIMRYIASMSNEPLRYDRWFQLRTDQAFRDQIDALKQATGISDASQIIRMAIDAAYAREVTANKRRKTK